MSFLLKYFDSLGANEDDSLWDVLYKLYGPIMEISFIFPSWRRSRLPFSLAAFIFYAFIFSVHIWILTIAVYCVRDDFNLASLEFHYLLIFMFCVIALFLMNSNRDSMINFHRSLATDVGKYQPGRIYDEDLPMQLEHDKRKQLLTFLFLPGFVLSLAGFSLMVPYLQKMDGTVHYNSEGANMKLPIPAWYPFPTHEGILSLLAVLGQFMSAGGLAATVATLDILIFRLTQSLLFEFQVLRYALDTLIPRAKRLYSTEYPTRDIKELRMKDEAFQRCIGKCLRDCVIHHHDIKKLILDYMNLVKWPGFLAYGFGTGVIGLSLINILSAKEEGKYENIVLFFGLAMAEVLNMFMLSTFGESLTTESQKLREQLYFIKWHNLDTLNRKLMLIFQIGVTHPVVIKVGGMVAVTLDTFSSIMNSSYSFFNLVNAQ